MIQRFFVWKELPSILKNLNVCCKWSFGAYSLKLGSYEVVCKWQLGICTFPLPLSLLLSPPLFFPSPFNFPLLFLLLPLPYVFISLFFPKSFLLFCFRFPLFKYKFLIKFTASTRWHWLNLIFKFYFLKLNY